jgi:acyl carrier protein
MPADPARVALAHQVLAQLGVSLADLHATSDGSMSARSAVAMPNTSGATIAPESPLRPRIHHRGSSQPPSLRELSGNSRTSSARSVGQLGGRAAGLTFAPDTRLDEVGLSSLQISSLLFWIEDQSGSEVETAQAANVQTLGDLLRLTLT